MANIGGFLQQLAQNYLANERQKFTGVSDEQAALNKLGVQQAQTTAEFQRPKAEAELRLLQVRPDVLQAEAERKAKADQELAIYRQALAAAVAGKEKRETEAAPGKIGLTTAQTENLTERTTHPEKFRTPQRPSFMAATGPEGEQVFVERHTLQPAPGGVTPALPAGERAKRGDLQAMISDAEQLGRLAAGPAGEVIGPVAGRIAGATRGLTDAPPEVQDLFHIADNLSVRLNFLLSGAQISEQEYGRLRKLMPNPRESLSKFNADLGRFLIESKNALAARQGKPLSQGTGRPAAPAGSSLSPEVEKRLKALGL